MDPLIAKACYLVMLSPSGVVAWAIVKASIGESDSGSIDTQLSVIRRESERRPHKFTCQNIMKKATRDKD